MANERTPVVLVADDDPSLLTLVAQHARTLGYRVLEASDGDQALELAREHLPDLIVLDVMMPGPSGWEVCRRVREDVALAHTGVVMLTGMGETLNAMTSPLHGADEYIDKPFEFPELDEKLRATLLKRASMRQPMPGLSRTTPEVDEGGSQGGMSPPKRRVAKKAAGKKAAVKKAPQQRAAKKTSSKKAAAKKVTRGPKKAETKPATKTAKKAAPKKTAAKRGAKKAAPKKAVKTLAQRATAPKKAAKKPAARKAAPTKKAAKPGRPARATTKKLTQKPLRKTVSAKKVGSTKPVRKGASAKKVAPKPVRKGARKR